MIEIDGSYGEGGGQVLRTSLALSAVTRTPLRVVNVRAGRKVPGLKPQHVACVKAAASICNADVDGATVGSSRITFRPRDVIGGRHEIRVGTAGSVVLVAQTVLPALVHAKVNAMVAIEGGTHVPLAPVFEHFERAYVPALQAMGARVDAKLVRVGFAPAGGGRIEVTVAPGVDVPFRALDCDHGDVRLIAIEGGGIPPNVLEREIAVVRDAFPRVTVDTMHSRSRGNSLALVVGRDVFSALGSKHVPAEKVAGALVSEARAFLAASVPIGAHLADQLLLPMALAAGGSFRTVRPTLHFTTNADIIKRFVDVRFDIEGDVDEPERADVTVTCRKRDTL